MCVDVDEVEYEFAPKEKRPRFLGNPYVAGLGGMSAGEDTGAEADNEKSEYETEGDMASLTGINSQEEMNGAGKNDTMIDSMPQLMTAGAPVILPTSADSVLKRKKVLVARPFGTMRGHTAFLTFATAGNQEQPNPNDDTN